MSPTIYAIYLEFGISPLQSIVCEAQARFFKKLLPSKVLLDVLWLDETWTKIQNLVAVDNHITY